MRIKKQIFTFTFMIIYCVLVLFVLIGGTVVFSQFIFGSIDSDSLFFREICYSLERAYSQSYKFHFSNLTVFLILLSDQYIRKFSEPWRCTHAAVLLLVYLLYIIASLYVFYCFGFSDALDVNRLNVADLTIVILNVLLSQVSSLCFHISRGNPINKKLIQGVYQCEEPIACIWIVHTYFSKYSFFLILDRVEMFVICLILFFILLLRFCYKIFLIKRMNIYCKNIGQIHQDCFVYIYNIDYDFEGEVFRYFLKPCIMNMRINPVLNGYVLFKDQYEYCKEYIMNHVCVGIDCYSKFGTSSNVNFYSDEFVYSVAIREKKLFKSDEVSGISPLDDVYFNVLTLKNFKQLKYSVEANDFLEKLQRDAQYIYTIKKARKELPNLRRITNIAQFDKYLISVLDKIGYQLERYTAFNTILKGYEAIIHYICAYYLITLDIKLEDTWYDFEILKKVESGGLGKWLEMVFDVLKFRGLSEESWLSYKIGVHLSELFLGINYPAIQSRCDKVNPEESYYHFLANRLVNLRNNTIGHGSSAYIPTDTELLHMYEIYAYLLIEIQQNFKQLLLKEDAIWIIRLGENVAFLDKLTPENNELRYLDYLSESLISRIIGEENMR